MANPSSPMIPRDGVLVIKDNTGTPKTLTIAYDGGDLQVSNLNQGHKTRQVFKSRGATYSVRDVEAQEIGIQFTADAVSFLGDGSTATLYEALMKLGAWSTAVSTLPSPAGDTYCLTLQFTVERTNFGGSADNVETFKYVYFDVDFAEGVPGKFTIKGTAVNYSTDFIAHT